MLPRSRQQHQRHFNPPVMQRRSQSGAQPPNRINSQKPQERGGVVNGLTKTLDGVQQVLNMVQTSAPIVQEYGPMIKNLPAMYRMVKVFKEIEKSDSKEEVPKTTNRKTEGAEAVVNKPTKSPKTTTKQTPVRSNSSGDSKPKLFI